MHKPMNEQVFHSELSLWAHLSAAECRAIQARAQQQKLGARKIIINENAPFTGLHIISSGQIKLCKVSGAREQILEILYAGDVLDPIPLFDNGGHAVTAKTMSPATLYFLPVDAAQEILPQCPALVNALLNIVSIRLRKLASLANDLAFKDVSARVCHALLEQSSNGDALAQSLSRQDLAALVGTSREVAWRALKKLERDGLIAIHGQQIRILDAPALAARA
jgi:CRP-like cAMP-binding protein